MSFRVNSSVSAFCLKAGLLIVRQIVDIFVLRVLDNQAIMLYTLNMNNDTSKLIVRLDKAVHQRLKVAVANGKADSMQAIVAKMIQTWLDKNQA